MIRLYDEERPADPVLLADDLKRAGLLDAIGGASTLVSLMANTPGMSRAGHYAHIVNEMATLRALGSVGAETAELAFGLPADVGQAVIQAQALLDRVITSANGSVCGLEVADVAGILAGTIEIVEPAFLTRSDGQALLYAGRMNVFQAEPTSGKSWLALLAAIEILGFGGAVIYIDYEDTAPGILGRLLALGADPTSVIERFRYVRPEGGYGPAERLALERLVAQLNPELVVIDGVAEALARDNYDEDKARDVVEWIEKYPRPLARSGCAVLMLDHVVKDKEKRGRSARGSGHKLAAVDGAAYDVIITSSFSRHRSGRGRLVIAKDRHGSVGATMETAAVLEFTPAGAGERLMVTIGPDISRSSSGDAWKPTRLMAIVSRELAKATNPLTPRAVRDLLASTTTKPGFVTEAIARLMAEGYVDEVTRGRTKYLRLVRPYTDDPGPPEPTEANEELELELGLDPDRPPDDPGF
jgi:hypothetical protein